jgi:hypothetical protein
MKLAYKITSIILFFTFGFINAQVEIRGKVISELTGKTPDSEVYIKELLTKQPRVMADSLGNFKIEYLEPNKIYIIEISAFGFPTQKFNIKTNKGIINEFFFLRTECEFDENKAESDWKNGTPKLLLFGSIAPIGNSKLDNRFEKKYRIKYFDFGCTPPAMDCMKLYNERIFKLMDEKHGNKWRKKVRKDVEYLK